MKTRNVKTAELSGAALDWATGVSLGHKVQHSNNVGGLSISEPYSKHDRCIWSPSTDWSQGGPLIDLHGITLSYFADGYWISNVCEEKALLHGETALIAACRAIVAAKLGDTVDVPEVLL